MGTTTKLLTIEEFRTLYGGFKPYYEYWNGEPIQKTMPEWLHSLIQRLMRDLLREAGWKSGVEVELRIDDQWQPVPDVIGASRIEQPYPTRPVEIVVEVLSPDDRMSRVIEKCNEYSRIGIGQIFVIDPEHRGAFEWMQETRQLRSIATMVLANGKRIDLEKLWERLDLELQ